MVLEIRRLIGDVRRGSVSFSTLPRLRGRRQRRRRIAARLISSAEARAGAGVAAAGTGDEGEGFCGWPWNEPGRD